MIALAIFLVFGAYGLLGLSVWQLRSAINHLANALEAHMNDMDHHVPGPL
jgi:hypothetical protein